MKKYWRVPKEQNADFVAKMEDVLDTYALAYNTDCPVICLDEKPYQLLDELREPIPMKPGQPQRVDNEYLQCGTSSIFVMREPRTLKRLASRTRKSAADISRFCA